MRKLGDWQVPDFPPHGDRIIADDGQALIIRGCGRGVDRIPVRGEIKHMAPSLDVPDGGPAIPSRADQQFVLLQGNERRNPVSMAAQHLRVS
jgi:hypothetical protein